MITELVAMDSTKAGGKPNAIGGAGIAVDHKGYRDSIVQEIETLNRIISTMQGGTSVSIYGRV